MNLRDLRTRSALRPAKPLVGLILLMSVVGESKANPPWPNAVLLYRKEGAAVARSLERNFYGTEKGSVELTKPGSIIFKPTDPADHLATPFVNLPFAYGQRRPVDRVWV